MTQKLNEVYAAKAEQRAIDCWTHGIAHLVEVLGHRRSTALMTHLTGYLIDRGADEPQAEDTWFSAVPDTAEDHNRASPRGPN